MLGIYRHGKLNVTAGKPERYSLLVGPWYLDDACEERAYDAYEAFRRAMATPGREAECRSLHFVCTTRFGRWYLDTGHTRWVTCCHPLDLPRYWRSFEAQAGLAEIAERKVDCVLVPFQLLRPASTLAPYMATQAFLRRTGRLGSYRWGHGCTGLPEAQWGYVSKC